MQRFTKQLGLLTLVTLCLVHVQSVAAQQIGYEKYKLDNGLTVILHEDHSLPVACVNLWYYVGSKDEPAGRSGFAHLFEHLMFMGTERVSGLNFDNFMESGGGWNNATTSEDRTNYFEMGPATLLPTLLWLEADRLEDLGRMMTQKKLDLQREVVRNERRQSYENQPYGNAELKVYELMFPVGHPYHIPVIGTHEDLEAATVDDVKNFFATYYVPNNCALVAAGDFKPDQIKPLIQRLFGTLPRGDDVIHRRAEPVTLQSVQRYTMTDNVQYARTSMVYHSPAHFAPGDAEMDLAAAVLAEGISSRLYQALVYENELAVDVSAYQASMLLGSLFYIEAYARPGVELDQIEQVIDQVIDKFVEDGPTAEELERQKARIEYGMISRLQSVLSKADRLNQYNFFFGDPDGFARDLDRYRDAMPDGVRNWARRVLTPDRRLILRVIPQHEHEGENPRDDRPELASAKSFLPEPPVHFKLSNGIEVFQWQRPELPMTAMTMLIAGGADTDDADGAGRAYMVAQMLDEGADDLDAIQFANALDQLGARFHANCDHEFTTVGLSVLTRDFDKALGLYADAILKPRFDEKEWKRVESLHVADLRRGRDDPAEVAQRVAMRTYFGNGHPYGRAVDGSVDTIEALKLDDVRTAHAGIYRPDRARIFIAGDFETADMKRLLEGAFGSWTASSTAAMPTSASYPQPANEKLRVVIVDKPGAVQTVVRFTMPGPKYANPNRNTLLSFNTLLGGSFTSRLNRNLREDKGYTYGARSAFRMEPSCGYFEAYASVRADVTGPSISEFLKEFAAIRSSDISDQEAAKARSTRRSRLIQSLEGLNGLLNSAIELAENNRPYTDLARDLAAIDEVDASGMNRLAHDAVPLESGLLVLVGDEKLIREQLTQIDLPPAVVLTVTGEEVH